jgi:hypothetical protein
MLKKIMFLMSLVAIVFLSPFAVADDAFDFDNFAIIDDDSDDINIPNVSLNSGAGPVAVAQFDIGGAMLGMTYDEINDIFFENSSLYAPRKNDSIIYKINKEWEYNLDYECRQSGIFVPEQLQKCIYSLARNRGLLYVSEIHLERTYTGETIDIYFTSNASDNVVWKIVYKNDANVLDGQDSDTSQTFENQRTRKLLAFWQGVLDKYGVPNSDEDKWISSENAYDPMMRAYLGQLELIDNGLNAADLAKNIQASRENFQAKPYAF